MLVPIENKNINNWFGFMSTQHIEDCVRDGVVTLQL